MRRYRSAFCQPTIINSSCQTGMMTCVQVALRAEAMCAPCRAKSAAAVVARHTSHKLAIGGTRQVLIISIHGRTPSSLSIAPTRLSKKAFQCERVAEEKNLLRCKPSNYTKNDQRGLKIAGPTSSQKRDRNPWHLFNSPHERRRRFWRAFARC